MNIGWICEDFLEQSLETIIEIYIYSYSIVALETCVIYRCGTEVWRDEVTSKIITYLDKDRAKLQLLSSDLKSFSIFITLVYIQVHSNLLTHPAIEQIFTEYLLCVIYSSGPWENNVISLFNLQQNNNT